VESISKNGFRSARLARIKGRAEGGEGGSERRWAERTEERMLVDVGIKNFDRRRKI
jgi:hypothetical protein